MIISWGWSCWSPNHFFFLWLHIFVLNSFTIKNHQRFYGTSNGLSAVPLKVWHETSQFLLETGSCLFGNSSVKDISKDYTIPPRKTPSLSFSLLFALRLYWALRFKRWITRSWYVQGTLALNFITGILWVDNIFWRQNRGIQNVEGN